MFRKVFGLKGNYKPKDKNDSSSSSDKNACEASVPRYQPIGSGCKVRPKMHLPLQHGNDTVDSQTGSDFQLDSITLQQQQHQSSQQQQQHSDTNCKIIQAEDASCLLTDSAEYKSMVDQIMSQVMGIHLNVSEDATENAHVEMSNDNQANSHLIQSLGTPCSTASSKIASSQSDTHSELISSIGSDTETCNTAIASSIKNLTQSVESFPSDLMSSGEQITCSNARTHASGLAPKVRTIATSFHGSDIYKMSAIPRGYCIIVNNVTFELSCFETRNGSDSEAEVLSDIFSQLGFSVVYLKNLCTKSMLRKFKEIRKSPDLEKHDALICIVLSHGDADKLVGSDGLYINVETVVGCFNNFNCPALKNKPRVFFIQACRGQCRDFGVTDKHTVADAVPRPMNQVLNASGSLLPCWADTLIVYSTVQGYVSMRNELSGSWFGHALCEVLLDKACDTELYQLMIEVNKQVLNRQNTSGVKQPIECVYRGWNKRLYFNPGHYEQNTDSEQPAQQQAQVTPQTADVVSTQVSTESAASGIESSTELSTELLTELFAEISTRLTTEPKPDAEAENTDNTSASAPLQTSS